VISTAIEGGSGTGLEAQSSQTDAVKSLQILDPLGIPSPLIHSWGYLKEWGYDHERMTRPPAAVRRDVRKRIAHPM
jgi:hypothetical protein